MGTDVRIRETKVLSKTKSELKSIEYEFKPDGKEYIKKSTEVYNHGNATAALLYNAEQRTIVLTEQFRIATYINNNSGGMLLEACAGLIEPDEAPVETIKREIREELGYNISNAVKVYEAYSSPGCITELLTLFVASYTKADKKEKGGGLKEEGEYVKLVELPFDQAMQMLDNGEIKDVKAIILLQYLRLKVFK